MLTFDYLHSNHSHTHYNKDPLSAPFRSIEVKEREREREHLLLGVPHYEQKQ